MRKLLSVLLCLFIGINLATAQTTKVSGVVISAEDGEPIIGASVVAKGTTTGTVTNFDGHFSLDVPTSAKLLTVSYVGMKTQEVGVRPNMRIVLESASEDLDEVIVVAYGASTRKSFTGSAVKVDGEKIAKKAPTEISKALQGEVAGVQVINASGQPGSNATIRIRGIGSVNSSRSPLYVVDGIPYSGDLSGIDPNDVASTTVLKDATATALYGTRAANGVILITTKKGKKGQTTVEADVKYGGNLRIIPLYETIESPERFIELTWEGIRNKYMYRTNKPQPADIAAQWASEDIFSFDEESGDTYGIYPQYNIWRQAGADLINQETGRFNAGVERRFTPEKWQDHIFKNGQKVEGNVKISGGNDNLTHFTSLGYLKDEGYYIGSDFQRFTARSNMDQNINKWLRTSTNFAYSYMKSNQPGQTDNMNNGFQFVNYMPPIFPVFEHDADGNRIQDNVVGGYRYDYGMSEGFGRPYASGINPAGAIQLDKNRTISHQFVGNGLVEVKFLKDFKFTGNLGIQFLNLSNSDLTNPYYGDAEGLGRISKTLTNYLNVTGNQILEWTKSYGDNNLNAFIAHESTNYEVNKVEGRKSKLARPDNLEYSNAIINDYQESVTYGYSMESYFGQARYDYAGRYFLHGTIRRDGSSRFSKGNKWGTFGSVGAAWAVTGESFMQNVTWVDNLKLKASWGVLGNQDFITSPVMAGYYPYNDLYNIGNMNDQFTFSFVYKGNPNLTWEKSATVNTGIEFSLFNIFDAEVEYYHKKVTDMLFLKQVAPSLGYAQYPVNDGTMTNSGVEFSLTSHIINTNGITLDFRVNGGHYRNKMKMMPMDETTGKEKPIEIQGAYGWSKGKSLYDFYLREYAGVNPETGVAQYNAYYNVKPDGSRELIKDMENYRSQNTIYALEIEKIEDYTKSTVKYVGKSAIPTLEGGFGVDFGFKGFELNTTFSYGIGGYAYDYVYAALMSNPTPGANNWHKDIENRWTQPGDVTDVPRLSSNLDKYAASRSDRFLTKRSYLTLSNVRLGYTFPKTILKKISLQGLNLYVTGDNLFYVSKRKGFVAMSSEDGASGRSQYLPVSTIMGGLRVTF